MQQIQRSPFNYIGESAFQIPTESSGWNAQEEGASRTNVCKHWARKGICLYGHKCAFLHPAALRGCDAGKRKVRPNKVKRLPLTDVKDIVRVVADALGIEGQLQPRPFTNEWRNYSADPQYSDAFDAHSTEPIRKPASGADVHQLLSMLQDLTGAQQGSIQRPKSNVQQSYSGNLTAERTSSVAPFGDIQMPNLNPAPVPAGDSAVKSLQNSLHGLDIAGLAGLNASETYLSTLLHLFVSAEQAKTLEEAAAYAAALDAMLKSLQTRSSNSNAQ